MDYKQIYNDLIFRAQHRSLESYTETHHIIPKCMGGLDISVNLAKLTPEEHYVAHQLLVKIYPGDYKLAKAAMMMVANRPSNKVYGWLRKKHAIAMSELQTGNKNSQYGTRWIHNNSEKISMRIHRDDPLPTGYSEGRKLSWSKKKCNYCSKELADSNRGNFCLDKCKRYHASPQYKNIDDNIEDILLRLQVTGSISGVLKEFGVTGNKIGNSYVSKIAKSRGIKILKRRNSSAN